MASNSTDCDSILSSLIPRNSVGSLARCYNNSIELQLPGGAGEYFTGEIVSCGKFDWKNVTRNEMYQECTGEYKKAICDHVNLKMKTAVAGYYDKETGRFMGGVSMEYEGQCLLGYTLAILNSGTKIIPRLLPILFLMLLLQ